MKKNLKSLSLFLVSLIMLTLVGCSNNKTSNNSSNSATNTPPTNQEYYDYLTERYDHYFKDNLLNTTYDIYVDDFTYDNSYDEFITAYNGSYDELKADLEAFKKDLQDNVVKGNAEVDKFNQEVITATDKAIISVDDYNGSFSEKAKDYATLSKDEVVKGLKSIGLDVHNAKLDLDNLIDTAKSRLGV
ncbi:hypothetical protein [Clostridium celatum]|uniref:hypothetical protein n=1 Tax=Clostridium celatum TaxID=36834 RepID=UPI001899FF3D|nr:hypothetical protein [Clostridium celatum]MDU2266720.1 hypothetical protein [Clostridium celatum]MDU3724773.1 hypothetical protein [Clostridium celatum]MDU6297136.1 hypothetical protein [Clostridium celatum]MDY3361296.1 hypothetical protein [Clostridium celatum]